MRIQFAGNKEATITSIQDNLANFDSSSNSVIGFSHFQHIECMSSFKFEVGNNKLYQLCETITSYFNSIQRSSRGLFSVDIGNSSKGFQDPIDQKLFHTMDVKVHRIALNGSSSLSLSLTNEETSISIDETSKINDIFSGYFGEINQCVTFAHMSPFVNSMDTMHEYIINVHRERLSDWNPSRVCDSLTYVVTHRGRSEEVSPPMVIGQ